jgi:hypothetical protein
MRLILEKFSAIIKTNIPFDPLSSSSDAPTMVVLQSFN